MKNEKFNTDLFNAFVSLYWLRPENGVLSYCMSQVWADVDVPERSIDLCTGDGTQVFLHCGGRFDDRFDIFSDTDANRFSHGRFVDIYNKVGSRYSPMISRVPRDRFQVGTDWKDALLVKAERLSFFQKLIKHDNNILPLPFDDSSFDLVTSNAIYWSKNAPLLLQDIARITNCGGKGVFQFCTPRMLSTLDRLSPFLNKRALAILDRKRSEEMKTLTADVSDWRIWIRKSGFRILDLRVTWPNQLVTDFWNIGLRPLAHLLIRMSEHLAESERLSIKREWVDICKDILAPLCHKPPKFSISKAPYVTFIVERS